jgi:L-seryl-tRNA(Ser) seleniumtransferase
VLVDLQRYGLPYEPTVAQSIAQGAAVVTCSGDKLLGGPQAGILVGRSEIIARLKKHPMARALRLDKMTLAALEATLRAYLDEERALREIPTLRMLTMPLPESRGLAEQLAGRIRDAIGDAADVRVLDDIARAGGGSLPITDIPTAVVALAPKTMSVVALEQALRLGSEPAIVGRVKDERLLLDPRTLVTAEEHDILVRRLGEIL